MSERPPARGEWWIRPAEPGLFRSARLEVVSVGQDGTVYGVKVLRGDTTARPVMVSAEAWKRDGWRFDETSVKAT